MEQESSLSWKAHEFAARAAADAQEWSLAADEAYAAWRELQREPLGAARWAGELAVMTVLARIEGSRGDTSAAALAHAQALRASYLLRCAAEPGARAGRLGALHFAALEMALNLGVEPDATLLPLADLGAPPFTSPCIVAAAAPELTWLAWGAGGRADLAQPWAKRLMELDSTDPDAACTWAAVELATGPTGAAAAEASTQCERASAASARADAQAIALALRVAGAIAAGDATHAALHWADLGTMTRQASRSSLDGWDLGPLASALRHHETPCGRAAAVALDMWQKASSDDLPWPEFAAVAHGGQECLGTGTPTRPKAATP